MAISALGGKRSTHSSRGAVVAAENIRSFTLRMQMLHNVSSTLPSAGRALWLLLMLTACSDDAPRPVTGPGTDNLRIASTAVAPPAASLSVLVQVPASMRSAPFNVDRYLTIPP